MHTRYNREGKPQGTQFNRLIKFRGCLVPYIILDQRFPSVRGDREVLARKAVINYPLLPVISAISMHKSKACIKHRP